MALAKAIEQGMQNIQDALPVGAAIDESLPFETVCLTSSEQVAELAEAWLELENQLDETFAYFQTFGWCYSWWNNVGVHQDAELRVFALKQNQRLLAVWPLQLSKVGFGATALTPMTYPHSEYSSALFHKDLPLDKRSEFVHEALASAQCDLVVLPKIPSGTSLEISTANMGVTAPIEEVASVFEFDEFESDEDYLASLSTSTRRSRKKRRNKLAKLGEIEYRVVQPGEAEFDELVNCAFEMKFEWLEATGRNDAKLKIEGLKETLHRLTADGAAKALLQALKVDGKPVALEIGLQLQDHYYAYIGAFDWNMRDYSVGKIQMENAVLWAINNGVAKYDLLAEPAGYKDSWSNRVVTLQNRTIARSFKGHMFGVVWQHHVRPRVKTLFNSLPSGWRTRVLGLKKSLLGR